MEETDIRQILCNRNYSDMAAALVAKELMKIEDDLKPLLQSWLQDDSNNQDYLIAGYSISQLQKERGMTYPAAILTIDWLMKDPDKAKVSLNNPYK